MISPIKYEVDIQEPLSTPVPMPPPMLSSEALVIWMFRIAMNEPIMAASTAIQTVALALLEAVGSDFAGEVGSADIEADGLRLDMARCSGNESGSWRCGAGMMFRLGFAGLDGRDHRHARTQHDQRMVVAVECDLDRDPLHHLGEIAGGVVGRQQREFLAAGGGEAVDVAVHDLPREHVDRDF